MRQARHEVEGEAAGRGVGEEAEDAVAEGGEEGAAVEMVETRDSARGRTSTRLARRIIIAREGMTRRWPAEEVCLGHHNSSCFEASRPDGLS